MPIRTARPQKGRWWGALVALVLTAAAPAAADGPGETGLRFEAPGTFVMYNADEGAKAENAAFVLPVAVVPGNTGPARNITVVVDVSGLAGVARGADLGGAGCRGGRGRRGDTPPPPGRGRPRKLRGRRALRQLTGAGAGETRVTSGHPRSHVTGGRATSSQGM
ncbi:hypothetical protein ACFZDJ_28885 [Streptomyces sp. NPDC007896]|uniref:hypothetical protein n=1 Tax=unclassified Streptomyces TaxID=2593676 RepID=UPI0036EF56CF